MDERDISRAAIRITDLSVRRTYIESICGENAELMNRVEILIESLERSATVPPFTNLLTADGPTAYVTTIRDGNSSTEDEHPPAEHRRLPETEVLQIDTFDETLLHILQKSDAADSIGRLTNYEIKRVIGRGAFGIVLEGFDVKLRRIVAVKVLAPTLASRHDEARRFLSEARAVAAIRHENVVHIYSVDEQPVPHLVMEFIPGQTLQGRIDEQGPLPLAKSLRIGQQIATALSAAHQRGIVHRDVKPSNILLEVENDDWVKITDFGLARRLEGAGSVQSGVIIGTPMYMAPEQAEGEATDERSDLFSLGSVLYFMVTGRTPFQGSSAISILKQVTNLTPPPIQSIVPGIPDSFCRIINRLHSKRPEERFESAKQVADELKQCLSELKLLEFPFFSDSTTPPAEVRTKVSPEVLHPPDRPMTSVRLRNRRWMMILLAPLAGCLIYVLFSGLSHSKSQQAKAVVEPPDQVDSASPSNRSPSDSSTIVTLDLNRLYESGKEVSLGDGSPDDVTVVDQVMTFDASGKSPNLWLDFVNIQAEEWTFSADFRNLTNDQPGFAKVVFTSGGMETCGLISNWSGKLEGTIELVNSTRIELPAFPLSEVDSDEWTKIRYVVGRDVFQLYVGDALMIQSPRLTHQIGQVAICVGHWRCQFRNPQVILQRSFAPHTDPPLRFHDGQ